MAEKLGIVHDCTLGLIPAGPENLASGSGSLNPAGTMPFLVICRRGNASQIAVQRLRSVGISNAKDVIGGLTQWSRDVDGGLPVL